MEGDGERGSGGGAKLLIDREPGKHWLTRWNASSTVQASTHVTSTVASGLHCARCPPAPLLLMGH